MKLHQGNTPVREKTAQESSKDPKENVQINK